MIKGVVIKKLRKISDERGAVYHMLRRDDKMFKRFGEIYFSLVYPNVVKGWHLHKKMTLNYAVPHGKIKLVLYDDRKGSPTKGELTVILLGENDYCLVSIPPGIWNGFKGLGTETSIVANCADMPHDPKEIVRMDPLHNDLIDYDWK